MFKVPFLAIHGNVIDKLRNAFKYNCVLSISSTLYIVFRRFRIQGTVLTSGIAPLFLLQTALQSSIYK